MNSITFPQTPTTTDETILATAAAFEELAKRIVERFESHRIPWCLLRNRDDIPMGLLQWADIDILVEKGIHARQLYTMFADLHPAQMIPYRDIQDSFFFPVRDRFLRVDMYYGDPEYRSVPFASNRKIIAGRWRDRGYMVAPTVYQPYVAGFSKLLWGRKFPARYAAPLGEVARQQPEALHAVFEEAFGQPMADELLQLTQSDRIMDVPDLSARCRKALWKKALRTRPLASLYGLARQMRLAVRERVHPTGLDVAVLGPDGSGKTTICRTIATMEYRRIPFHAAEHIGLYHHILPTFTQVAGHLSRREVRPLSNARAPHATPPHHPLVWFGKYLYYTLDQWISEVTWMRHHLSRSMLILRDRHLMELEVDARRYRYMGPLVAPRIIARLAPRPDLVILLDVPPEVLLRRKQDLEPVEAARQCARYRDLVAHLPHGYIVNGDQPLEKVISDMLAIIVDETNQRTQQRFGCMPSEPTTLTAS